MSKVVNFEGKRYNFPDDASMEEIHGYLRKVAGIEEQASAQPTELGSLESMGIGAANTYYGAKQSLGMGNDGDFAKAHEAFQQSAKTNPIATGIGAMGPTLAAAVPAVLATPFTGGLSATALGGVLGGTIAGTSDYSNVMADTGDREAAMKSGLTSGVLTGAEFLVPASLGGKLLGKVAPALSGMGGRALEGIGLNVGINEADTTVRNRILSDYPDLQREHFDPVSTGMAIGLGGVFGAMSPRAKAPVLPKDVPATPGTLQPPPIEQATTEQLTRLTSQQEKLTSYRSILEEKLLKAEATVALNPDKAYVLEKAQRDIQALDDRLASVNADIETVTKGGKEPVVVPTPDKVNELTVQLVEKTRRANEISAKALNSTRPQEAVLLRKEAESLIAERDSLRAALTQAKKDVKEAAPIAPEATVTQGDVPPYMPTTPEAPSSLAEQGRASSVQVKGDPISSGQITETFNPDKVRTWSDEAIGNTIAGKEAKYAKATSAEVRGNIQSELNILYDEQQRRAALTTNKGSVFSLKDGSKATIDTVSDPEAFGNLVRMQYGEPVALIAKDSNGKEIGKLTYMPNGGPIDVSVGEAYRRKGVGTALYKAHEAAGGKILPESSGVIISDEARALRNSLKKEGLTLAEQGRATSNYAGEGANTDEIREAFRIENFLKQSPEAQAHTIANKQAKLNGYLSAIARANIESELDQIYRATARQKEPAIPSTGSQGELPLPVQTVSEKTRLEGELAALTEHAKTLLQKNGRKPSTRQVAKRAEYDRVMEEINKRSERVQELDIAQAREDAKHMDFSQEVPQYKTPPTTIAGLRTAVETGGWVAGLNHIIANLPETHILSVISKSLLKNKWISPVVRYKDIPELGRYHNGTENIEINGVKAPDSATALVHEVVHRGSSNAIDQFEIDPSKLTSRERRAINQLTALYNSVKDLPRVVGTKPVANLKEFLAYGLSHEGFASYLNNLKGVEKVSIFRKTANAVMDLLGFDTKVRTAYSELLGTGETLIASAREINPQADRATLVQQIKRGLGTQNISTVLKHTQDQLVEMVKAGQLSDIGTKASLVYKNVFGKLQLNEIFNNQVVNYVSETVRRAEAAGVEFKHTLTYGINPEANRGVGKRFMSTKQYVDNNSVYKTFHALTSEMGAILHDWDSKFFGEHVSLESIKEARDAAGDMTSTLFEFHLKSRVKELQDAGVNPKVIDAYTSQQKAMNKAFEDNNIILKQQGRTPLPFRPDYHPAVRKGKFAVSVFANDILYRVQLFRTEMEAKLFQDKMASFPEYKTQMEDIEKTLESTPNLEEYADFAKDMFDRLGLDPSGFGLNNALDQMTTTGMKFGKHQEFRQGLSGYAGSEWFKTRTELGNAYKSAIFDWIDEQSSIRVKQDIKYNTERLLSDQAMQDALPNATNMARHIRDMGMNVVPEWGWAKVFDTQVRNAGDGLATNAVKLFGKKDFVAKVSPLDKTLGLMSSMFYLTTLMGRPGFWVSQVLTAPSAIRHILRDTEIPLMDIITSFSKGSMRSFGVVPHDAVSAEVMRHLIDNTTTLRPQLQNELNTIKWMESGSGKKFAEVMRVISGQSPSEAADIISRVWTANMMIEHYRGKGLKGMELNDAVANATDLTMVAYNRSNKAAWVDKAGILGQAANPLLTYGTAQLGNLVADIHFMAKERTLRSALPALSTMLVTQLMAGAIGLPILVEYQFLRDMLVSYDPDLDWMPDPKKIITESPAWLERGIPSAVTGFDVGSGMRWNPFLAKFFLEDNKSIIDTFPAIAFMGQVGKTMGMAMADITGIGKFTEAEKRKAYLAVTPFVGGKALVDATTFNSLGRDYVPGGRSYAVTEQTPKEHLATLLGSRTVERARLQDSEYQFKQEERRIATHQQKLVDLVADQGQHSEAALNKLAEMGLTGDEINSLLTDAYIARNTPTAQRLLISGGSGPASLRKKSRLLESYGTSLGVNQ